MYIQAMNEVSPYKSSFNTLALLLLAFPFQSFENVSIDTRDYLCKHINPLSWIISQNPKINCPLLTPVCARDTIFSFRTGQPLLHLSFKGNERVKGHESNNG